MLNASAAPSSGTPEGKDPATAAANRNGQAHEQGEKDSYGPASAASSSHSAAPSGGPGQPARQDDAPNGKAGQRRDAKIAADVKKHVRLLRDKLAAEVELTKEVTVKHLMAVLMYVLGMERVQDEEAFAKTLRETPDVLAEAWQALEMIVERSQAFNPPLVWTDFLSDEGPDKFLGCLIVFKLLSDGVDLQKHSEALDVGALNEVLCNARGVTTLQEFASLEYVLERCSETGLPMQLTDTLGPGGVHNVMRATLHVAMDGISDDTKRMLVLVLQDDVDARDEAIEELDAKLEAREGKVSEMPDLSSDKLLVFLAENLAGLQQCEREKKDAYVLGLLDIYLLQRQKVERKFVQPSRGEMPHEIAHSPMKPLSQELSHRTGLLVHLFPAQRVVWGAFVDLSRVVRPLRAKNLTKQAKYVDMEDRFPLI